jgi:hypothetical protein
LTIFVFPAASENLEKQGSEMGSLIRRRCPGATCRHGRKKVVGRRNIAVEAWFEGESRLVHRVLPGGPAGDQSVTTLL